MAVTERELGRRIRAARRACGRTQREVSRTLGISRSAVALLELGQRRVSGLELERLAALYGRSPDSLLSPERTGHEALDRLLTIAPDLGQADTALGELKRLLRVSREMASLESTLAVGRSSATAPSYDSPLPRTEWEAIQQSLRTADEERRRLDLGVAPIRDVAQIMSVLSIRTASVTFPADVSGVFLNDPSGHLVAVRRTMPVLQRRFMYAHGFAHVLFDRQDDCHVCRAEHTATCAGQSTGDRCARFAPTRLPRPS
jgi:transcriptional regulator with XRE-family HTH domain